MYTFGLQFRSVFYGLVLACLLLSSLLISSSAFAAEDETWVRHFTTVYSGWGGAHWDPIPVTFFTSGLYPSSGNCGIAADQKIMDFMRNWKELKAPQYTVSVESLVYGTVISIRDNVKKKTIMRHIQVCLKKE